MNRKRQGVTHRGARKSKRQGHASGKAVLRQQTTLKGSTPIATLPVPKVRRIPALTINGETVRPAKETLIQPRCIKSEAEALEIANEVIESITGTRRSQVESSSLDWTNMDNPVVRTVYAEVTESYLDLDWELVQLRTNVKQLIGASVGTPIRYWKEAVKYLATQMRQQRDMLGTVASLEELAEDREDSYDDSLRLQEIPGLSAHVSPGLEAWVGLVDSLERLPSKRAKELVACAAYDYPMPVALRHVRDNILDFGLRRKARPLAPVTRQLLETMLL